MLQPAAVPLAGTERRVWSTVVTVIIEKNHGFHRRRNTQQQQQACRGRRRRGVLDAVPDYSGDAGDRAQAAGSAGRGVVVHSSAVSRAGFLVFQVRGRYKATRHAQTALGGHTPSSCCVVLSTVNQAPCDSNMKAEPRYDRYSSGSFEKCAAASVSVAYPAAHRHGLKYSRFRLHGG